MYKSGPKHYRWRGGRKLHSEGYIYKLCHGHPRATKDGYVLEHIIVMEDKLGRSLGPGEIVHHLNEVKSDNRPDNLEVMLRSDHIKHHHRKLSNDQEATLLHEWRSGNKRHIDLAAKYGVSKSTIGNIITRERKVNGI